VEEEEEDDDMNLEEKNFPKGMAINPFTPASATVWSQQRPMTIAITFPLPLGFLPYPKQPRACVVLFANASHSHEIKQVILFFFFFFFFLLRYLSESVSQQQCKAEKPAPCC
jgi:hypothetical protein